MTRERITDRIDAITRIPQEARSVTPPAPPSVKIELTAVCNLKCFFCASYLRLRPKAHMDWEFFIRIVEEMRKLGVRELGVFYLGESFLYPRLVEAIHFAKKACGYPYVFLTTNGILATPEKLRECMQAGLDSLKFSFNYSDPDQFRQVTRTRAELYQTLISNIKASRRVRDEVAEETSHRCGVYASSILYDGQQQERMAAAVGEIRDFVDEHYWLPLYNQAGLIEGTGVDFIPGNRGRIGALRDPLPCWSLFTEGHITYDGFLSACCFDHDGRFHMGDLKTTPFLEAWHSDQFQALRRAHLEKNVAGTVCERCVLYS